MEIFDACVDLTFGFKSDSAKNDGKIDFHTNDLINPLQSPSDVSSWYGANMSLVEYLKMSISNPFVVEELRIVIWWPKKHNINLAWEWNGFSGVHRIFGTFPNNQNMIDLYTIFAPELFQQGCTFPQSYATACMKLILAFDQPTWTMPNTFEAASLH
jgi:hypothetical protein